jgi:hypothetical protein
MVKKILFLITTVTVMSQAYCLQVVKQMDRAAMSSDYKKIAWFTYQHKKKLDYIRHAYSLLEKMRNESGTQMMAYSSNAEMIVAIPTVEMAKAEADALTAINTVNLSLLNLLIYKSIEDELKDSGMGEMPSD